MMFDTYEIVDEINPLIFELLWIVVVIGLIALVLRTLIGGGINVQLFHKKTRKYFEKYFDKTSELLEQVHERIKYINSTPAKIKHSYKKETKLMIRAWKYILNRKYKNIKQDLKEETKKLKDSIYDGEWESVEIKDKNSMYPYFIKGSRMGHVLTDRYLHYLVSQNRKSRQEIIKQFMETYKDDL